MQEILNNSNLLTCSHSKLTIEILSVLYRYKFAKNFKKEDFADLMMILLEFLSQRCKNPDALTSYRLFLLNKIDFALGVVVYINKEMVVPPEELEGMLDIPIEEFLDAQIDEEFVKKINNE
jgi:hypothetical protein